MRIKVYACPSKWAKCKFTLVAKFGEDIEWADMDETYVELADIGVPDSVEAVTDRVIPGLIKELRQEQADNRLNIRTIEETINSLLALEHQE